METEQQQKTAPTPHVLVFPFPTQGHVNPMLQLAELLCLAGIQNVTFLNTHHQQTRLLRFTDTEKRFSSFPGFKFQTIPDVLPDDHSRYTNKFEDIFQGIRTRVEPAFRQLLFTDHFNSINRPVTCIITDRLLSFSIAVAAELHIPVMDFDVTSACFLWCSYCHPNMVQAGELPFQDDDMDKLVTSVPGMEGFLRCRDLPSFYRGAELKDRLKIASQPYRPCASIINTFHELEAPILSQMSPFFPKLYTLGPLHALLNSLRSIHSTPSLSSNNSLYEVDQNCIAWLDSQPLKSVIYVSFGSSVMMRHAQMLEFWYGLVNSGKRFLWAIRPDSVINKDLDYEIPAELSEGTKDRGCIVGWSPQEEVLVHPSVGGFLTHSGWGSTMESIFAGVPMVCWPFVGDQLINSRFVSHVWKIGLDMKDMCDRETIKKMVDDLLDDKREQLMKSTERMSQLAKRSVCEGGSSYTNFGALVEDIKSKSMSF